MHSVLVRSYKYRYGREGIVQGTWYNDFLLDPKSVTIDTETYDLKDHSIQMSNQSIVVRGRIRSWKGGDPNPLHKVGDRVKIDIGRYLEPPPGMYREELDNLRIGKSRFARRINTVLYLCKSILYIDWKEYLFEYLKEHLMEMKMLFDRIRTDTLLEELDG